MKDGYNRRKREREREKGEATYLHRLATFLLARDRSASRRVRTCTYNVNILQREREREIDRDGGRGSAFGNRRGEERRELSSKEVDLGEVRGATLHFCDSSRIIIRNPEIPLICDLAKNPRLTYSLRRVAQSHIQSQSLFRHF